MAYKGTDSSPPQARITIASPNSRMVIARCSGGLPSGKVTRAFCPTCGSPVYTTNSGMPDFFIVEAASLDDPTRFAPQMIVYTSSGFAWDHLDPALPRSAKMPVMPR